MINNVLESRTLCLLFLFYLSVALFIHLTSLTIQHLLVQHQPSVVPHRQDFTRTRSRHPLCGRKRLGWSSQAHRVTNVAPFVLNSRCPLFEYSSLTTSRAKVDKAIGR